MAIRVRCESCDKRYLLRDTDAGRKFKCKNCSQVIVAPEPSDVPEERNLTKDTAERLCPSCDNATLKERTLKSGLQIDVCPRCNGQWLDGGELMQLTRSREAVRQSLSVLSWDSAPTTRRCPRCQTLMNQGVFLDDSTNLDFCEDCNGLWFDEGELNTSLQFLNALAVEETPRKRRKRVKTADIVSEAGQSLIRLLNSAEWPQIDESPGGFALTHRNRSGVLPSFVHGSEVAVYISALYLLMCTLQARTPLPLLLLLPLLAWTVTLRWFYRTGISANPHHITVQHAPGPWPIRVIRQEEIHQVYICQRSHRNYYTDSVSYTYGIMVLLKDGRRRTLISGSRDENETQLVAEKIAEYVGARMGDIETTGYCEWVKFTAVTVFLVILWIAKILKG